MMIYNGGIDLNNDASYGVPDYFLCFKHSAT